MKKIMTGVLIAAVFLSCVTTDTKSHEDFFTLHGGAIEPGPMGYIVTGENVNSMAVKHIEPYTGVITCNVSLQIVEYNDILNGFLLVSDQENGGIIKAGVYIGAGEYAIEGSGVVEPIRIPVDFDQNQVFHFSLLINFEKGFIEMKTNEREIGTGLASNMKQVNLVGYHADSTKTHFSEIEIFENP